MRLWRVTVYVACHEYLWENVESSTWIQKSYISVKSGQYYSTRQNEQKHEKAFSEQELKK